MWWPQVAKSIVSELPLAVRVIGTGTCRKHVVWCELFSRATLSTSASTSMSFSEAAKRHGLPDGVWPTMITPFLDDEKKSVDWNGLDSELVPCLCREREHLH